MNESPSTSASHPYRSVDLVIDAPEERRALCIAASALSVLGAFFLFVKVATLLPLEAESFAWVPYVAHVFGALSSGAALVAATPSRSWRDAAAGAAIAIVLLTLVSVGIPRAFSWSPMRTSTPWLVVSAIFAATTACSALGARLALSLRFRSTASIGFLAITIAGGMTFLGGRVVHALVGLENSLLQLIFANVAAFVSALLTQSVVVRRAGVCALGVSVVGVLHLAESLQSVNDRVFATAAFFFLTWGAGVLGARLARPAGQLESRPTQLDDEAHAVRVASVVDEAAATALNDPAAVREAELGSADLRRDERVRGPLR